METVSFTNSIETLARLFGDDAVSFVFAFKSESQSDLIGNCIAALSAGTVMAVSAHTVSIVRVVVVVVSGTILGQQPAMNSTNDINNVCFISFLKN